MPRYDYQCKHEECQHTCELEHSMHEDPPKCPECGEDTLKRLFTRPPRVVCHYSPMHPRANRGRGY
jgi:putative FmdB family regulatory protein